MGHMVDIAGVSIEVEEIDADLFLPSMFNDAPNKDRLLQLAKGFVASLPAEARKTPWIVGSLNRDLQGLERTSRSHALGQAVDISPMYSHDLAIAPDGSVMGLAWNLVTLDILSQSDWREAAWIVEGDHIHIVDNGMGSYLKSGCVLSVPTLSPWYDLSSKVGSTKTNRLFHMSLAYQSDPVTLSEITLAQGDHLLRDYISPLSNES